MERWLVNSNKSFIDSLDGVRGIAILMVIFTHFLAFQEAHSLPKILVGAISRSGWMGVPLFFVLSGYLISKAIIGPNNFSISTYLLKRASKIMPPFYLSIAITTSYLIYKNGSLLSYLKSALATGVFIFTIQRPVPVISPIYWSLGAEFFFYLTAPFILLPFKKNRLSLFIPSLIYIFTGLIGRLAFEYNPTLPRDLMICTLGSFTYFGFGILLNYFDKNSNYFLNLNRRIITLLCLTLFILLYFSFGCYSSQIPSQNIESLNASINQSILFTSILSTTIVGIIFGSLQPGWWFFNFLSLRPLVLLGIISYELYLFHELFGNLFNLGNAHGNLSLFLKSTLYSLVLSIVFSSFVYKFLSLPILRFFHKIN
jgi:peptidoglycan/LPS O-acetylase OafA/YrhL